ncbi:hypothetical protein [Suttonella indologenes]|uniref:Uncharacterized protein n=1 Tax=Suttonella indologenes TaxID=13276 RepID=A0A380MIW6_9GAMM|nr:hypothetical protein [Suttonella indologenes]SUO92209.1 Uncharacterised protein [Suttonella indologenes]
MRLIKRREPPFKSIEDTRKMVHDFEVKKGSYEFMPKYKFEREIKEKITKYVDSMFITYVKLLFISFPIYLALASLIWFFNYKEINYQIYLFLKFFYLPMQHPYGWNLSFVLSFIINTWIFIEVKKAYDFSLLKEITMVKRPIKYIISILFFILLLFFILICAFLFTLTKQGNACTMRDLCILYSDSMFLHSTTLLFMAFSGIYFLILTICILKFSFKYAEINIL